MVYLLALFLMGFKWSFRYTLGVPRFMVPDNCVSFIISFWMPYGWLGWYPKYFLTAPWKLNKIDDFTSSFYYGINLSFWNSDFVQYKKRISAN